MEDQRETLPAEDGPTIIHEHHHHYGADTTVIHVHGGPMSPGFGNWFKDHVSKPLSDAADDLHDKTGGVL